MGLAADLRDPEFARDFLLAAMGEGAMGVEEFTADLDMAAPQVQRAIKPRHNPTLETLNRCSARSS